MEASLNHLDTRIDKFDLEHLHFDVPVTNISGLTAKIYQSKPLVKLEAAAKDMAEAKQPAGLHLAFEKTNLEKIKIDYRNDVSATYANLDLGLLHVKLNKLDLDKRIVELESISLKNTNTVIRIGKTAQAKVVVKEAEQEAQSQVEAGWRIHAASLDLADNTIAFDNDNNPRLSKGMDYAHLKVDALELTGRRYFTGC